MNRGLFDDDDDEAALELAPGAVLLRRFALANATALLADAAAVQAQAPLRHMRTPGGLPLRVAMTNCGPLG